MVDLTVSPQGEHGTEQAWRSSQARRRSEEIFKVVEVQRFGQLPGSGSGAVDEEEEDVIVVLDEDREYRAMAFLTKQTT